MRQRVLTVSKNIGEIITDLKTAFPIKYKGFKKYKGDRLEIWVSDDFDSADDTTLNELF